MAVSAQAGDAPSAEVRERIETYLQAQGFTRWDEIEGEGNGRVWKIDDARHTDGRKHELKVNAQTPAGDGPAAGLGGRQPVDA